MAGQGDGETGTRLPGRLSSGRVDEPTGNGLARQPCRRSEAALGSEKELGRKRDKNVALSLFQPHHGLSSSGMGFNSSTAPFSGRGGSDDVAIGTFSDTDVTGLSSFFSGSSFRGSGSGDSCSFGGSGGPVSSTGGGDLR